MSPRTMADRLDRARQRAQRREALHVLLARVDRLTPVEAALLAEYVRAELDASDHLRATIQGQQNAMQEASDRTRAAEAAIVEAEKDRDRAEAERDALAGGVPLVCSDERHKTKVQSLEAEIERLRAAAQQLLNNGAKAVGEQNWARHHAEERAEKAEAERDEARMWARHGYEIGQRSCTWTDHGVAPAWLTEPAESAALDEHQEQPLRAPDGTPICTCTYGKRCPACRD